MESSTIIFFVLFLIIFSIIGIGYIIYESLKYKQNLEISLDNNNKDVKNRFNQASNNISIINDNITSNKISFQNFSSNILYMSSNISNVLTNNIVNNSNLTNQLLNNFDNNLSKYFVFNEGGKDIHSATNNNKIFNYLFGGSTDVSKNLDLIQKTTAIGGITVKTDVNKELKICNTEGENCIKMETDVNNNFYLSPTSESQNIYIGGTNSSPAIRINNQDVYIKNLHIENKDSNFIEPLKTECIINIKPNIGNNNYDTNIKARVFFESSYKINSNNKLFIYIPYIDIGKLNNNNIVNNTNDISLSLYKSTDTTVKLDIKGYIGNLTIDFGTVTDITAGYILDFSIILTNKENITSLSNTTTNFTFTTKSYFMQ